MTEQDELTRLCDEIARMIPSETMRDTATSQFKEFIDKMRVNGVKPQEIKNIIKAYNYFNGLMGVTGDDATSTETKKSDSQVASKEERAETKTESKDTMTESKADSKETMTDSKDTNKDESEESDMVELLLHLSDESEPKENVPG